MTSYNIIILSGYRKLFPDNTLIPTLLRRCIVLINNYFVCLLILKQYIIYKIWIKYY